MPYPTPHQSVASIFRSPNDIECFKVMQQHFSEKPGKQDWMESKESNDPKLFIKNIFEHTSRKAEFCEKD